MTKLAANYDFMNDDNGDDDNGDDDGQSALSR